MQPHPRGSSTESTRILDSTLLRWQTKTCSRLESLTKCFLSRWVSFLWRDIISSTLSFYWNHSSTLSQTLTTLKVAPKGEPTYVVGRCPTLHTNVAAKASTFPATPTEISLLFSKLIFNLDMTSNYIKDKLIYSKNYWLMSQKIKVSSTNKR